MTPSPTFESAGAGLAVALGCGLLIGLERERRKRRGPQREAAGLRSFALAALAGAVAQLLAQPLLVGAGALAVLALVGLAYARSRFVGQDRDPGLTTELALFITYLLGVLAMEQAPLAAAAGVVVAALLAAREQLHRFATRVLTEAELHDTLLLGALALVLLPLLPAVAVPWLGGLVPRTLVALLVLILLLQAAGHVALRLAGPALGLALSGFFAGFVSSTATVASLGARARQHPGQLEACAGGAVLSTAATWVQATLLLVALSPPAAMRVLPAAAAGVVAAAACAALWLRRSPARLPAATPKGDGPLRLREALLVALVLSGVSLLVGFAQQGLGNAGVLAAATLGALADAHASVAALGALHAGARIDDTLLARGVLVAVGTNAALRCGVAALAGGRGYGLRVALSLLLSTLAAGAWLLPA